MQWLESLKSSVATWFAGPTPGESLQSLPGPLGNAARNPAYRDGMTVPHVLTFGAIVGTGWAYYHDKWDEAIRKDRETALAMWRDANLSGLMHERYLDVAK